MGGRWFHGSRSDFKTFTIPGSGKHGVGFYFTADRYEAHYFAHHLVGVEPKGSPKIFEVVLSVRSPFNTMSIQDSQSVAKVFGFDYRVPSYAGGAKEHYHHLANQLIKHGYCSKESVNSAIQSAGFDSIYCEFFGHLIVLNSDAIEILEVTEV